MYTPRLLSSAILAVLLVGCGGSGGGSSSTPTTDNPPPVTTPPPVPKLTASVANVNACDIRTPQTDAVLIVHNEDMSNKEVHIADENGAFNVELIQEPAVISVLATGLNNTGGEYLYARTFSGVRAKDIGEFTFTNSNDVEACECTQANIVLESPVPSGVPRVFIDSVRVRTFDLNEQGEVVYKTEVCREQSGNWPALTFVLEYPVIDGPRRVYSARLENYEPAEEITVSVAHENAVVQLGQVLENDSSDMSDEFIVLTLGYINNVRSYSSDFTGFSLGTLPIFNSQDVTKNRAYALSIDRLTPDDLPYIDGEAVDSVRYNNNASRVLSPEEAGPVDFIAFDRFALIEESKKYFRGEYSDFGLYGADYITTEVNMWNQEGKRVLHWSVVHNTQTPMEQLAAISFDGVAPEMDLAFEPWEMDLRVYVNDYVGIDTYSDVVEHLLEVMTSTESENYDLRYFFMHADVNELYQVPFISPIKG